MKLKAFGVSQLLWASMALTVLADDPATKASTEQERLTAEAEATVRELRSTLPKDSEAIAMLDDILQGSNLSAKDGWFPLAKVQTRFDWQYVQKAYDADGDAAVRSAEFTGSQEDFARLDRNGDQQVTEVDSDWSEHSLTPRPGLSMFFMADRDANGKLTREEFAELFQQLGGGEEGYLAIDDLRDQFLPSPPSGVQQRPDGPSPSTLVMGLKNQEIGSLQPGPDLDQSAPDFTLRTLDGEEITLSKEVGDKPIVLIFGNFTCGPFRSQAGNIEKLYKRMKRLHFRPL